MYTTSRQPTKCSRKSNEPVKLVFLLQDLEFGGTQRQIIELASRLDPSKFLVEVWVLIARDDLVDWARSKGIKPIWISRHTNVLPGIDQIKLWQRLHAEPIDLLMLLTGVPNIWGRILGHLTRIPIIIGTCRGENNFRLQFEKWLWPFADHIICNALKLKKTYLKYHRLPPSRLSVIYNAVDTNFFQPPRNTTRPASNIVLCIARMVPDKDHDTLLQAFRLVAQFHPEAELWLMGEGHRQRAIKRLAADILPPQQVKFFSGKIDIRPLLSQAALLVLSSINEGMPNVILEAMSSGLPVVATRVGGLAEVIIPGRNGWLVPPRNVPALAAAIAHLLEDFDSRVEFGRAGRKIIEQHFSMTVMVQRYQDLFNKLLTNF